MPYRLSETDTITVPHPITDNPTYLHRIEYLRENDEIVLGGYAEKPYGSSESVHVGQSCYLFGDTLLEGNVQVFHESKICSSRIYGDHATIRESILQRCTIFGGGLIDESTCHHVNLKGNFSINESKLYDSRIMSVVNMSGSTARNANLDTPLLLFEREFDGRTERRIYLYSPETYPCNIFYDSIKIGCTTMSMRAWFELAADECAMRRARDQYSIEPHEVEWMLANAIYAVRQSGRYSGINTRSTLEEIQAALIASEQMPLVDHEFYEDLYEEDDDYDDDEYDDDEDDESDEDDEEDEDEAETPAETEEVS